MRPVDFNLTVGRMQDITPMKQNEDARPAVEQQNITTIINQDIETKQEQVYQKQDKDMDSEYDSANGQSKNEYEDRRNPKKKKKDEDGTVVIKQHINFDVKI